MHVCIYSQEISFLGEKFSWGHLVPRISYPNYRNQRSRLYEVEEIRLLW